tara:strand:- start:180 stop:473 length:294 start_codon:yes stop_codon:yes gene_type:complete
MFIKIHKSYRIVVSICDSDLIGKTFEEGKFQIDIREKFYKGEEVSKEKALEILKDQVREDATFNIVGEESIKTALEAQIISEESVKRIDNIPVALVF